MLSHSSLMQDFSWPAVLGHRCKISHFMIYQMFSIGEKFELQAGQFSTPTLLLQSHAVVVDTVRSLAFSS